MCALMNVAFECHPEESKSWEQEQVNNLSAKKGRRERDPTAADTHARRGGLVLCGATHSFQQVVFFFLCFFFASPDRHHLTVDFWKFLLALLALTFDSTLYCTA